MGAALCPLILNSPISLIGNLGSGYQAPFLQAFSAFIREFLGAPTLWPQPLTRPWGVESTYVPLPPTGSPSHHEPQSPTGGCSQPPPLPIFCTFLDRVGLEGQGGEETLGLVITGLVLLGSPSKATLGCEEQLVNLFGFTISLFSTGTLHVNLSTTGEVPPISCYLCYKKRFFYIYISLRA